MSSCAGLRHMMNVLGCIVVCFLADGTQAADSDYPNRPIRLVVGFAPGGGADASARIVAPKLSDFMGQNWLVDNRTGAGGNLASEIVARANPDGYTVLLAIDTQLTASPTLYTSKGPGSNCQTELIQPGPFDCYRKKIWQAKSMAISCEDSLSFQPPSPRKRTKTRAWPYHSDNLRSRQML